MKSLFAFMLICCLMLSLCACDDDTSINIPNLPNQNIGGNIEQPGPTTEEWADLWKYCDIVNCVIHNSFSILADREYSGQDAIKYCYEQLQNMAHLDKWIGSEYVKDDSAIGYLGPAYECATIPRQPLLDGFVILDNVILFRTEWYTDALDNKNTTDYHYTYDREGNRLNNSDLPCDPYDLYAPSRAINYPLAEGTPEHTYDSKGKVSQLRYLHRDDTVNCVITYTYNADGTVATEKYKDRNGMEFSVVYTYANGLLIKAAGIPYQDSGEAATIDYSYDEAGRLVKEYHTREYISNLYKDDLMIQYTYDNTGNLINASCADLRFQKNSSGVYLMGYGDVYYYTYSYNNAGNLTQSTYQEMGSYDENGNYIGGKNETIYYSDYIYGKYYIYPQNTTE